MSLDLIPVRLWWESHPHGGRGEARYYAVERVLTVRPDFLEFWAIQFSPGVCAIIQPYAYPWRDMERVERMAAMEWLRRLTDA